MEDSFQMWRNSSGVDDCNPSVLISSDDEVPHYVPINKKRVNRILDSSDDVENSRKSETPKMSRARFYSTPLLKNVPKSCVLQDKNDSESFLISDSDEEVVEKANKECIYICDSSSDKENNSSNSTPRGHSKNSKSNILDNVLKSKAKRNCNKQSLQSSRDVSNSDSSESDEDLEPRFNTDIEPWNKERRNSKRKDVTHDDTREFIKGLKGNTSSDSIDDLDFDEPMDCMTKESTVSVPEGKTRDSNLEENFHDVGHATSLRTMDTSSDCASGINVSEDSKLAMSLVEKELGSSNIDALTAQKREFLLCKNKHLRKQLADTELLMSSMNMDVLSDKGERIQKSIADLERQIEEVETALKCIPSVGNIEKDNASTNQTKTSEYASAFKNHIDHYDLTTEADTSDHLSSDEDSKFSSLKSDKFMSGSTTKVLGKKAQATHDKQFSLTVESLQELHGSLVAGPKENDVAEDPAGLKVKLMPHQQHALAWGLWREKQKPSGGILADDMGLGKTLTMISLILKTLSDDDLTNDLSKTTQWCSRKNPLRFKGGTLVICPASLLAQWEGEIKNRCKKGLISVQVYHGHNREIVPSRLAKHDVVITTYNILSREHKNMSVLFKIDWKRVVLDEAHIIRNHKNQASAAVCDLHARIRWALTGTPIHNKEMDLYAVFKFLRCSPFDDLRIWKHWVNNNSASGHQRLATIMKTLMLRRTKQELQVKGGLSCLPSKFIEEITVTLNSPEQLVYQKVLVYSRTLFAQFLSQRAETQHMISLHAGKYNKACYNSNPNQQTEFTKAHDQLLAMHAGKVKAHEILVLLLRLRQICCHPALIHAMLDREDMQQNGLMEEENVDNDLLSQMNNVTLHDYDEEDGVVIDARVKSNILTAQNPVFQKNRIGTKMKSILDKVAEIIDTKDDKLIIVSQWAALLDVVASHLSSIQGATFKKFTGQVPIKDRQAIQDSFNKPNSAPRILLLSLTAGGVGLNLVGGNHLLLIDNHWNPQLESQAQDRIYRFGQTKDVHIYKFICKDTIEERIKKLQMHKLSIAQNVLSGEKHIPASKLTLDDLKSLFEL